MNTFTIDQPTSRVENERARSRAVVDRILVPTDFSPLARLSVEAAVAMVGSGGGQVDLVHVIEPACTAEIAGLEGAMQFNSGKLWKEAQTKMNQLKASVGNPEFVSCHLLTGRASRTICEMARENHTDLIMISSHGRTGVERILLGSVAESIVHDAGCSVLVVKPAKDEKGRFAQQQKPLRWTNVLVGYDHRPGAERALAMAERIADRPGTHLSLLHALTPPDSRIALNLLEHRDSEAAILNDAMMDLNTARASHLPASSSWDAIAEVGHPWDILTDHAQKSGCDLIVVGPHEHTRWGHDFMGSTAQRVVRLAPCAVLVVK